MDKMDSTYHVGDRVRIVRVDKCYFGENSHMRDLVGEIRTIKGVYWEDEADLYRYALMQDHGGWSWDDSCFEFAVPPELPEFDISEADVASLFC